MENILNMSQMTGVDESFSTPVSIPPRPSAIQIFDDNNLRQSSGSQKDC